MPNGHERVLHRFMNVPDGRFPSGRLARDELGNLYGTTENLGRRYYGTVYKLSPDGSLTVLFAFKNWSDGVNPADGVVLDDAGNLYGTTALGGTPDAEGVVFKLAPDGSETVLHNFDGSADGGHPSGLTIDSAGNLYGVTTSGGDLQCDESGAGCGVLFKIAPDGTETVLHSFEGHLNNDGRIPVGLLLGQSGNLYGVTTRGGERNCDCGTVYEFAPGGNYTILYSFAGRKDGAHPQSDLIEDNGRLLGTAYEGGQFGYGTVFAVQQ